MRHHKNNLDFIRLASALFVVLGHSYALVGQAPPVIFGMAISTLGVAFFFSISGYLVTESWLRDPNPVRFLRKRALRIMPALIVVVLFTAFIIGPLYTTVDLSEYFRSDLLRRYLLNAVLYVSYALPGVFLDNIYPQAVNGSLWSLPIEATCYIIVLALGIFRLPNRLVFGILGVLGVLSAYLFMVYKPGPIVFAGMEAGQFAHIAVFFAVGSAIRAFEVKFSATIAAAMLAILVLVEVLYGRIYEPILWLMIPYMILAFGFRSTPLISDAGSRGDFSYGIYLYSFPLQQAILQTSATTNPISVFLTSALLSLACAFFSWHYVERPALLLKPRRTVPTPTA